jgi:hypothetical protein
MKQQSNALGPLLAELESVIGSARDADLPRTVALLRLARLDLLLRAKGAAPDDDAMESIIVTHAAKTAKPKRKPRSARA